MLVVHERVESRIAVCHSTQVPPVDRTSRRQETDGVASLDIIVELDSFEDLPRVVHRAIVEAKKVLLDVNRCLDFPDGIRAGNEIVEDPTQFHPVCLAFTIRVRDLKPVVVHRRV